MSSLPGLSQRKSSDSLVEPMDWGEDYLLSFMEIHGNLFVNAVQFILDLFPIGFTSGNKILEEDGISFNFNF